ncbi:MULTISPECIES: type II toxin-antitoxin system MqsA family antitoxin [Halomonadaceae]|uniref:Type II toxin-antitoxin system MqsA family antitoxin n=1 Tax=Vreelandella halophila TaxID=86177 RepID=A0A9X4YFI6_9GAMM|nr:MULTISPECIES: type II toxin-antitoxin system MqsA family antitoxin [Halomonas]MYL28155.1 type II toxin-antitoxin system MqsA family antitoxin [Halomonas utahensis]MYL76062.1 type II toxin-antitoxin system MqsA family antitoxin [Halomonas sp. 22501_18_FS]
MNGINETCPVCEEGVLQEQVEANEVEYKGIKGQLPLHYAVCTECGSEQAGAAHALRNKRSMMAFRKEVDGLLKGTEMLSLRKQLGLTQAAAAKLFGGGPTAFAKYEADDVAQSFAMDRLLRVARDVPDAFAYLRRLAGMEVHPEPLEFRLHTELGGSWRDLEEPHIEADVQLRSLGVVSIQDSAMEYAS